MHAERQQPKLAEQLMVREFKKHARMMVTLAVELGILVKPKKCEFCGLKEPLQAHHHDYREPLDVTWFCVTCHHTVHMLERGTPVEWVPGEPRAKKAKKPKKGKKGSASKKKTVPRGTRKPKPKRKK